MALSFTKSKPMAFAIATSHQHRASYTRGGQLRLLALDGPGSSTLHIATVTSGRAQRSCALRRARAAPRLPRRTCAVPRLARRSAKPAASWAKCSTIAPSTSAPATACKSATSTTCSASPSATPPPPRPLGRRYIGVIRITATHAAHAEFSRESGQAPPAASSKPNTPLIPNPQGPGPSLDP